jgi:hypothetical protein
MTLFEALELALRGLHHSYPIRIGQHLGAKIGFRFTVPLGE